ncbi:hypothetical protein L1987_70813 [Smallanthus sonchifolius]|uniref:Uncharacterized protein n=1 Tax=Smallanthus sonchifolius TaxID=185202 RepID=A0ACB9AQ33_9ASTR|nr:hypothetical protein L1987_70813 [Smallanthus sonchifolius]
MITVIFWICGVVLALLTPSVTGALVGNIPRAAIIERRNGEGEQCQLCVAPYASDTRSFDVIRDDQRGDLMRHLYLYLGNAGHRARGAAVRDDDESITIEIKTMLAIEIDMTVVGELLRTSRADEMTLLLRGYARNEYIGTVNGSRLGRSKKLIDDVVPSEEKLKGHGFGFHVHELCGEEDGGVRLLLWCRDVKRPTAGWLRATGADIREGPQRWPGGVVIGFQKEKG